MDIFDWYFKQIVTQGQMDWAFDRVQSSMHGISEDNGMFGIVNGLTVSEHSTPPDKTVDVAGPGTAYDKAGQRCYIPDALTVVDCSKDEFGTDSNPPTATYQRYISVFIRFDRNLTDPALDGNNITVYTKQLESFELFVRLGAEAPAGTAVPPPLMSDAELLVDILVTSGFTAILNTDLDTSRREDWVRFTGSVLGDRVYGTAKDAVEDILGVIETWGGSLPFSFTSVWQGGNVVLGSSPPPATIQEAIDAIVYDLSRVSGSFAGSKRVGIDMYNTSGGHVTWPQTNVDAAVKAVADELDSFEDLTTANKWAVPLSNLKKTLNVPVASALGGLLWHPSNGKLIAFRSTSVYVSDDHQEWETVAIHTLGATFADDPYAIDTSRYLIGTTAGNIEYCTDPDGSWSSDAIGGSGNFKRIATKYPSSDFTMALRGFSVRIAASGVGGGWVSPTTPPPGMAQDGYGLVWAGGSTWLLAENESAANLRMFISTDDGDNWAVTAGGILANCNVNDIGINPVSGTIVIVGADAVTTRPTIYRTTDNGVTYSVATLNYPPFLWSTLDALNKVIHVEGSTWIAAGTTSNADMANFWVSHDDGVTWTYVNQRRFSDAEVAYDMYCGWKTDTQVFFGGASGLVFGSIPLVGV